jgi:16S rRNA processing protein RimM
VPARRQDGGPEAEKPGVAVAQIVRPHGRRGEVAADLLTDFPELLIQRREVLLHRPGSSEAPRRVVVRSAWLHKRQAILHFEGSDSISDAEKFVGLGVTISLAERAALPEGNYYYSDFIGCEVYEVKEVEEAEEVEDQSASPVGAAEPTSAGFSSSTSLLGTVREVQLLGGPAVLAVDTPDGELLIPFAAEICVHIDLAARRIFVRLPAGLRELNRGL